MASGLKKKEKKKRKSHTNTSHVRDYKEVKGQLYLNKKVKN